jgi:hypothetical protein
MVEPFKLAEIVPGDIVLAKRGHRFFIHRVLRQEGFFWILRGDSMPEQDPPVPASDILGRVARIDRCGRVCRLSRSMSRSSRILAWLLCHSDVSRSLTLRAYSAWSNRSTSHAQDMNSIEEAA